MSNAAKHTAAAVLAVIVLATVPFFAKSGYTLGVLTICFVYGIWAASLDFMSGLTGRMSFGHTLFIGAAAYTTGYLNARHGLGPWLGMPVGIVMAVILSLIVGLPTLRLRGAYFVLATLTGTAIMHRLVIIFSHYTGGEDGIAGLSSIAGSDLQMYYICLAALVLTTLVLIGIARSRWGLLLRAIHGDEAACQAAGINVTFYKMAALMISAAFAGLGGALYVQFQGAVTPEVFSVALAVTLIIMIYVGGLGSIYGAVAAAMLLSALPEMLRGLGDYRLAIYSVAIILIVMYAPGGLIQPLWQRLVGSTR